VIYLDDDFPDHPKVVAAGGQAAWLFICGLGWLKRSRSTDGLIPKPIVPRLSDLRRPADLAQRLVAAGLWHDRGDAYEVHQYAEHNARSIARSETARANAQKRWQRKADATAHATAMPSHMPSHGAANGAESAHVKFFVENLHLGVPKSSASPSQESDASRNHGESSSQVRAPNGDAAGDAIAYANAHATAMPSHMHQSPTPYPQSVSQSVESHRGGPARRDDDDEPRLCEAVEVCVERRIERNPSRSTTSAGRKRYRATVAASVMAELGDALRRLAREHPALDADGLADLAEPADPPDDHDWPTAWGPQ
jgi:hypothetical protein